MAESELPGSGRSTDPHAGPALLSLENLHAGYGRADVLHGVNLQLAAGQSMCLVGPNGAGKSTVLNAVFGLAEVHSGRITMEGVDLQGLSTATLLRDQGVAYVLQDDAVFADLSVEQNLRLGAYLVHDTARVREDVERVFRKHPRLASRRLERAGVLSGGERRSLEIARALMMRPRLLLIDEPSIGLEPIAVAQVFDQLRALVAQGETSILLVEQNVRQGLAFADVGCVLVDGRIVASGKGSDLLHDPAIGKMFLGS